MAVFGFSFVLVLGGVQAFCWKVEMEGFKFCDDVFEGCVPFDQTIGNLEIVSKVISEEETIHVSGSF